MIQILNDFLKDLDASGYLQQFTQVEFVADTGTHYRCNRFLGSLAKCWPEAYTYIRVWSVVYGLEHHLKDVLDEHFGRVQRALLQAEQTHMMTEICHVVDALRHNHTRQKESDDKEQQQERDLLRLHAIGPAGQRNDTIACSRFHSSPNQKLLPLKLHTYW